MTDLRKIDLNLLIIFEAIYASKNISLAGRNLGISQPTVSNSLGRLRDTIGDQLFTNTGRGVEPTATANEMIEPIREALDLIRGAFRGDVPKDVEDGDRRIRIYLDEFLEPLIAFPLLDMIKEYKNIELQFIRATGEDLLHEDADVGIRCLASAPDKLSHARIGPLDLRIIRNERHTSISDAANLEDFRRESHVAIESEEGFMRQFEFELQELGIQRKVACLVSNTHSIPDIVSKSDLIGVIPYLFARQLHQLYPIQVSKLPFMVRCSEVYLIYDNHLMNNDSQLRFIINMVQDFLMDLWRQEEHS
ncbi:MAG: LysR family transcriptional regulator [Pseudomonadota bacterium]